MNRLPLIRRSMLLLGSVVLLAASASAASPVRLRCEYLKSPQGIDAVRPRLSWQLESDRRGVTQTAYRIRVASSAARLESGEIDLWDSGIVKTDAQLFIRYDGAPLRSRQQCHWQVEVWDDRGLASVSKEPAGWTMGLLAAEDWTADYISFRDETPVHADPSTLDLPAARQYRRDFKAPREVTRATLYATALGIYELHINGDRVGDGYFAPGWTDYRKRAYYHTYDVTEMIDRGDNAIGAWVADGWYSGYVGFGLLTGMGTEKTGRAIYGKTPSVMAQLEIEYADGTTSVIGTDTTWKVTDQGPIQEADLLMGERYDARREMDLWSQAGFDDEAWDVAILASDNAAPSADFYQFRNPTRPGENVSKSGVPRELGFKRPSLEAFPGVPVRVTEELAAKTVTEHAPGTYIFDLGQNFAGSIRLAITGEAGQEIQIRYAEMLHPDGRMMTENLRKARATDTYLCSGDPDGEIYQPRFTFHGFQYVEVKGCQSPPALNAVTGLVLHSDTPMASTFECSDPMVNQLFRNVVWTQRSNFLDLPTDCPQRDERMGWTGDAQAYVATAAYNADIGAFYTKWLRELMESQRPSGAFPGYAPFPFQHGWDFGTAWADAGVICPWTLWQFYGDTAVIDECWGPMTRFMQWRKRTSVGDLGIAHGNAWGDWLAQGAETPLDYIDTVYLAISSRMMAQMATATGRMQEAAMYRNQFERTQAAFVQQYLNDDGSINVPTQTAQALALFAELVPPSQRQATGRHLAAMIAENGNRMATGFLGTRPLLPVLSESGQHDLATFLLQSREFPSWGYEIANGATTIWERWDSYTKEDAFGRHNAAMNSFSHYAFGAVCEWMFATLAGIRSDGPGFKRITIRPTPPRPASNAMHTPVHAVSASYESIRGTIRSDWRLGDQDFELTVEIPPNTSATVHLPTNSPESIREGGDPIDDHPHVTLAGQKPGQTLLTVESGTYRFSATHALKTAQVALETSEPMDNSINPSRLDLTNAREVAKWDFAKAAEAGKWKDRKNVSVEIRGDTPYIAATGQDSQMAVRLPQDIQGDFVIALRAKPSAGATVQFYWARPGRGFSAQLQSKRRLMKAEDTNDYLFEVKNEGTVRKLRFDPFATFDPYADRGEMVIETIILYQLQTPESE